MLYEFQANSGARIEREYAAGTAPKIGRSIVIAGRRYRRIPSGSGLRIQVPEYRCVEYGLPKRRFEEWHEGKLRKAGLNPKTGKDSHEITKHYPRVDNEGRPVFHSHREIDQFNAAIHHAEAGQPWVYDR